MPLIRWLHDRPGLFALAFLGGCIRAVLGGYPLGGALMAVGFCGMLWTFGRRP